MDAGVQAQLTRLLENGFNRRFFAHLDVQGDRFIFHPVGDDAAPFNGNVVNGNALAAVGEIAAVACAVNLFQGPVSTTDTDFNFLSPATVGSSIFIEVTAIPRGASALLTTVVLRQGDAVVAVGTCSFLKLKVKT